MHRRHRERSDARDAAPARPRRSERAAPRHLRRQRSDRGRRVLRAAGGLTWIAHTEQHSVAQIEYAACPTASRSTTFTRTSTRKIRGPRCSSTSIRTPRSKRPRSSRTPTRRPSRLSLNLAAAVVPRGQSTRGRCVESSARRWPSHVGDRGHRRARERAATTNGVRGWRARRLVPPPTAMVPATSYVLLAITPRCRR